ncbi:hypothetical protein BDP27DRAFT_1431233 [Rhodocollybia butyracea]|uniref:Uncharacterized protein n=1 Tax=Rhodocollybia butyracea TaxID=206335 RepID=A0A9P5TYN9_9AGAR|nr:hypothetical protein BDP27DRAFT_1431233 [Rhodocollybia butyracea]
MTAPFLESYCYLSKPGHGTITILREIPVADPGPHERQILEIANTLAFLCVQGPQSEVYAVALRLTGESLKIYIAENNEVPEKTKDHLENLLSKLSQISVTTSQSVPRISPDLEDAVTLSQEHEFGVMALKHSFPSFFRSLTKRDHTWDTRIAQIREQLVDENEMAETFERIVRSLDIIYKFAERYHDTKDEQTLSDLYEFLSLFDELIRRSLAKQIIATMLKKLDPGDNDAPLLAVELKNEADINPDNTLQDGFSITRFIYRIIATVIHIRRLLLLAVSPRLVQIFRHPAVVQCCPLRKQTVTVYSDKSSDFEVPGLVSSFENTTNLNVTLHAELNVFQTLLEAALIRGEHPYWVIGVSKLTCISCYTLIRKAFPAVLGQHIDHGLAPITLQDCHGKLYSSWAAPDLSFAEPYVQFDLNSEVRMRAEHFIRTSLLEYVQRSRFFEKGGGYEELNTKLNELRERYRGVYKSRSGL